jgi:hypothetical protein
VSLESLRRRFDDDSAYDRLMLETVVGADLLLRELPSSSIDDLRGASPSLERHVSDSLGAPARAELLDRLRPLLFATAWKVLDLIVDLIRELATGKSRRKGWPIEDKAKFVSGRRPGLPEPFISYPALEATVDDGVTNTIAWRLDELRGITRLAPIGPTATSELRVVRVELKPAGRRCRLDLKEVRDHLASQSGFAGFADIEAYLPDTTTVYRGRLEDAPDRESVEFSASRPPPWLNRGA